MNEKPTAFDPFQDRLSRDIRNDLSSTFSKALAAGDPALIETLVKSLLTRDLSSCYRDYILSRIDRFRRAFDLIRKSDNDVFRQGFILWDLQLFFEVHEVLEHAWYHAQGEKKLLLQALIRAAGVYIKLEFGYSRQAGKMAERALPVLEKNAEFLGRYFPPEEFLSALRTLDPHPPILLKDPSSLSGLQ
ncbi:MAG: DUF309 domain-containing protein [Desulfobulbaceae bacterium]|nr:MAG: DUF309 domain-containing protein [Desulfobulbaceae bacterium]